MKKENAAKEELRICFNWVTLRTSKWSAEYRDLSDGGMERKKSSQDFDKAPRL